MELELEAAAEGGSRVVSLSRDTPAADLGRGDLELGGPYKDLSISRRHISLCLLDGGGDPVGVAFEVVGTNPVIVRRSSNGGDEGSSSRIFRGGEKGELRPGDALSLSLKAPSFWAVRRKGGGEDGKVEGSVLDAVARRERRTRERKERERERLASEEAMEVTKEKKEEEAGFEVEGLEIDLASIDPVKEFGFLSMGHEFDSYPKGRIRPPRDWNWFLEDIKRNSDDEEDEISNSRGRPKGRGGNKEKEREGEDENWTDESGDEKESLSRGPSVKRTKYATRSKSTRQDPKKPRKENPKVKSGNSRGMDEDEEDETLGGFIVNEEDEAMDEFSEEEEEGEEEFEDEDDDD